MAGTALQTRGAPPAASQPTASEPAVEADADIPNRVPRYSADDVLTLLGSGVASLLLVWILYDNVLPTSGLIGFLVLWFVAFLGLYAVVLGDSHGRPFVVDRLVSAVVWCGAGLVGVVLASAITYSAVRGHSALFHWNFLTQDQSGATSSGPFNRGGILQALVGTLIEIGIAILVALPLGLGAAVLVSEVGGRLARVVRTVVEAMTALPSIVAGLFIYSTLVVKLGVPKSGIAAAAALTVMMLPIIARSADVMLRVVPGSLREAGEALGSSSWRVVRHVVLPTARSGLGTALILGIARGVGETSPVLLTSGYSSFLNLNPFKAPMSSLPLAVFFPIRSPDDNSITRGFAAATVLMALVLILFIVTRLISHNRGVSR